MDEDARVFRSRTPDALGVGDEVGREVAGSNSHAFDDFEGGLHGLDPSTVMTPSLPTFFMASAMMLLIWRSLLAEMVPYLGDDVTLDVPCAAS